MKLSIKLRTFIISLKRKIIIFWDYLRNKDYLKTVSSKDLGFDESKYYRYSTNDNFYLIKVLKYINIKNSDSMIDIGSGKGSVLRFFFAIPIR